MVNKESLIKKFSKSDKDVGSVEVQLALITSRIKNISEHLRSYPKDNHSRTGLLKLVGKKRKFSKYLIKKDKDNFEKLNKELKKL